MEHNMSDMNEDQILDRIRELERRIDDLSIRIERQLDRLLDEDLKARGLK